MLHNKEFCYLYRSADIIGARVVQSVYDWAGWSLIPGKGKEGSFCLCHGIQTGSGAHPPSYTMNTGGVFLQN
jgi:hypothetical protein